MDASCRNCRHCIAKIKTLPFDPRKIKPKDGKILWYHTTIHCSKGYWLKNDGEEFVIVRFVQAIKEGRKIFEGAYRCEEFRTL